MSPFPQYELNFDEAEAIGLDGTGRDMDPRFPHKYSTLTDEEKVRFWQFRIVGSGQEVAQVSAMRDALEGLGHGLSRLYTTWIVHDFEGDFVVPELGLPLSMSVDEAAGEVWALTGFFGEAYDNVFRYAGKHRGPVTA